MLPDDRRAQPRPGLSGSAISSGRTACTSWPNELQQLDDDRQQRVQDRQERPRRSSRRARRTRRRPSPACPRTTSRTRRPGRRPAWSLRPGPRSTSPALSSPGISFASGPACPACAFATASAAVARSTFARRAMSCVCASRPVAVVTSPVAVTSDCSASRVSESVNARAWPAAIASSTGRCVVGRRPGRGGDRRGQLLLLGAVVGRGRASSRRSPARRRSQLRRPAGRSPRCRPGRRATSRDRRRRRRPCPACRSGWTRRRPAGRPGRPC